MHRFIVVMALFAHILNAVDERPIVVVIPSRNNIQWCEKNVTSVLDQDYGNYRVMYIDDDSKDGTPDCVQNIIAVHERGSLVTLIRNQQRCGALANIYKAVHACDDREIIVFFDGDDWFNNPNVLARVNAAYENPNVWMTYGQYEEYPHGRKGQCRAFPPNIVKHNLFREYDWIASHLRTCYAGLFKQIKLQDLIYDGMFFDVTWDMAFMFPMLEMAGDRHAYIDEVLYMYNMATPSNDFKTKLVKQIHCRQLISAKNKYTRLPRLFDSTKLDQKISVVVCAQELDAAHNAIDSVRTYGSGYESIIVLYKRTNADNDRLTAALTAQGSMVHCIPYGESESFKQVFMNVLQALPTPYVLLMNDQCIFEHACDLRVCTRMLESTKAHVFSLTLDAGVKTCAYLERTVVRPPLVAVNDSTYAWQFKEGEYLWRQPFTGCAGIYRVADVCAVYSALRMTEPAHMVRAAACLWDMDQVGLCFVKAPVQLREH